MIHRVAVFWALVATMIGSSVAYAAPEIVRGQNPVQVPISIRAGHIYIDIEINGKGPFHFIFDSGALNVLTPAAAQRLDLTARGSVEAVGTGGSQKIGSAKVKSVRLGGLTLSNQTFYVLDLPPGASEGGPIDGLIGYEWLNRFPMLLDYVNAKLTLFPAKDDRYSSQTLPTPLFFKGRLAQIEGKVDGIGGRFSIDTGSSVSLTLTAPFVAEHNLIEHYQARTRLMSARGVGGPVFALLARAEILDIGNVTAKRPVTFLSQQTSGTNASNDTAGNIGFGILRQFNIFFDYPRKQITFEPNANWGQPDLADRSGLRLERSGSVIVVAYVADNSPAAKAGLKQGDLIVAVNKTLTDTMSVEDAGNTLKGPIGTQVLLTLDGSGGTKSVTLEAL